MGRGPEGLLGDGDRKRWPGRAGWLVALWAVLTVLLSGCSVSLFRPAEQLYAQPQLPERYKALSGTIRTVLSNMDGEQIAPLSGSNTAAIQLVDLDGDRTEEAAVAFYRVNSADDLQPLKIYIFRTGSDGAYQVNWVLQGEGNNINSVAYDDLDGDGSKEVVVSWQLTSRANVLSVYALRPQEADELIHTTYNESYALTDLNQDGLKELLIVQRDDTGEDNSRVNCYTNQSGTLMLSSAANLSENVTDVTLVRSGVLAGQTPALYVTSECGEGRVTDIFTWRDGTLVNVTLNPDSRISNETLRANTDISAIDINGDGVLEIPVSETLPPVNPDNAATYWLTHWRQFDERGQASSVCITYHCSDDGWYLVVPNSWDGEIAVDRNDNYSYRGERAMVFYHQERDGEMVRFLTVYRLTGDNRLSWASRGSRQLLRTSGSVAYAVEFYRDDWDCELTAEQVKERFHFINAKWSTG